MTTALGPIDYSLRHRANLVVPGGMWGHMNAADCPRAIRSSSPAARVDLWDVDGPNISTSCAAGAPCSAIAIPQSMRRRAGSWTGRLSERAWRTHCRTGRAHGRHCAPRGLGAVFQERHRRDHDLRHDCARRHRQAQGAGRQRGLSWRGPLVLAYPYGVMAEDRAHLLYFDYNDVASLEAPWRAGNDLAAIVVSAFNHDYGRHQELPDPEFAAPHVPLRRRRRGPDHRRCSRRLSVDAAWQLGTVGVRPDLSAWSKAIANGYALAAVTGNDRFRGGGAAFCHRLILVRREVHGGGACDHRRASGRKWAGAYAADGAAAARRHRRAGAAL